MAGFLRSWVKKKVEYTYISKAVVRSQLIIGSSGVLHVGAHRAQEHGLYSTLGKNVIWVEAIPELARTLTEKFAADDSQVVINALVGDKNQANVSFHLANNDFSSSSLFKFGKDLNYFSTKLELETELKLRMTRLDSVLSPQMAEMHSHWVFDIQGCELLALEGAGALLKHCRSLEVEVSTIDHYHGGAKFEELNRFLYEHGFVSLSLPHKRFHGDIFYVRTGAPQSSFGPKVGG